uniref:response regulator transcription factor n=1 Tax=uncultured Altererythrobacter sp. TaxID=500840 RepID=UPI00261C2E00|nr:LuxR C-terminal-related transcriptional regulator [uncultured Altererythrobacter sp.]
MSNKTFTLHYIDPASRARAEMARLAFSIGYHCEVYGDLSELATHPPRSGLVLVRETPGQNKIGRVFAQLERLGIWLPLIALGEEPRPAEIVTAIKAGALDYLALSMEPDQLLRTLTTLEPEAEEYAFARRRVIEARNRIENLSGREREVLDWLSDGNSNKVIARGLDISPCTVEIHRANMMAKLGAHHAADAVRLKIEAKL